MKRPIIILFLSILVFTTMYSQNEDQFLPSELKQLTVVTEPATLRQGFFRAGTFWHHAGTKTIFDDDSKKYYIPGSDHGRNQAFDFSFQYGITDRLQVNFTIPYSMDKIDRVKYFDDPAWRSILMENYAVYQFIESKRGFGFGDLSAGIFTQVVKESDFIPAITIRTTAVFPTGRKDPGNFSSDSLIFDSPTGTGEFKLALELQARKIVFPYSFSLSTGIEYGFGGQKVHYPYVYSVRFQSGTQFFGEGRVNFHLNDWICMTNELKYTHIGRAMYDNITLDNTVWRLSYTPSLHFQVKKLRLVQSIQIPLKGKAVIADPIYQLIVQFIF